MVNPADSVLMIDDDRNFLHVTKMALARKGITSYTCSAIDEALEEVADHRYGIVVSDYFLPGTDGRSLLRRVLNIRRDCELILTSSYPIGVKWTYPDRIEYIDKAELIRCLEDRLKRRHGFRGQNELQER